MRASAWTVSLRVATVVSAGTSSERRSDPSWVGPAIVKVRRLYLGKYSFGEDGRMGGWVLEQTSCS